VLQCLVCVVVCCGVLQCVAVCCSVLDCGAVWYSESKCVAVRCNTLQCDPELTVRRSGLQYVTLCCSVL